MRENDTRFTGTDHDKQRTLRDFLGALTTTVRQHVRELSSDIGSLSLAEQQALISKINPYLQFEFKSNSGLNGLPVHIAGSGLMLVSDMDGNQLQDGLEVISDDVVVTGRLIDVCALPVPTFECLSAGDEECIPVFDQVLSPVIILEAGTFRADWDQSGGFQVEHDFDGFQICLPLAHRLVIDVAA